MLEAMEAEFPPHGEGDCPITPCLGTVMHRPHPCRLRLPRSPAARAVPRNASMTHPLQGACYNNGFLYGSSNWACSGGYRLPFSTDYNLVAPCITASDYGREWEQARCLRGLWC